MKSIAFRFGKFALNFGRTFPSTGIVWLTNREPYYNDSYTWSNTTNFN